MIKVRLMTHKGKFRTVRECTCESTREALELVVTTYAPHGFRNFEIVDEIECDGARITATTPGGRNLAFFDYDPGEEC